MVPLFVAAGGAARRSCCAFPSSSGTRTGTPAGRCGWRRRSWTSSSASAPARSRSRRRNCTRRATRSTSTRFTPSDDPPAEGPLRLARAGPDGALEGLRHDARCTRARDRAGPRRRARATRPPADRGREGAPARAGGGRRRVRCPARPGSDRAAARAGRDSGAAASGRCAPQRDPAAQSETLDKVVYEAAACGVPVIASNTALDEFLAGLPVELRFRARDAESLAETLLDFAAAGLGRSPRSWSRAPPPRRRRPLRRIVGGYGRGDRCRPDPRVTSSPWRPSPLSPALTSRDRDVRAARPYVLSRAPLRTFMRRLLGITSLALLDAVGLGARPLHRARPAQHRLRRSRSLEPALANGVRGVAAVPDPDHPARLLAGGAVRHARAPRRSRAGRVVAPARRR